MTGSSTEASPTVFTKLLSGLGETQESVPEWVRKLRAPALREFSARGLPTRRDEEWRYTSMREVSSTDYEWISGEGDHAFDKELVDSLLVRDEIRLVFVGGHLSTALSDVSNLPPGVHVLTLDRALAEEQDLCTTLLAASGADEAHSFELLNRAFLGAGPGALIRIDADAAPERPLHLVFVDGDRPRPGAWFPRVLVDVGRHGEAELVETYVGATASQVLTSSGCDVRLGQGARLRHARIQWNGDATHHVGMTRVSVARDGLYDSMVLTAGGRLVRNDLHVALTAEGAEARLQGVYLTRDGDHVDNHTSIDHQVPRATSTQLYKGVLDGKSRAVFNGKVFVRPGALGTVANQLNKNLLLSSQCEIDTKPELAIEADDVRCSHGAAIGRPSEAEIFYLRSRGIPLAEARRLLSRAFAEEVVFGLGSTLADRLKPLVGRFLEREAGLETGTK